MVCAGKISDPGSGDRQHNGKMAASKATFCRFEILQNGRKTVALEATACRIVYPADPYLS